jgi:hypothetical protein
VELFNNFFFNFSTWVNEQLACVHDYFDRILSTGGLAIWLFRADASAYMPELTLTCDPHTAYDEVAAHDVQWELESVNWMAPCSVNLHRQKYVSFASPAS